ncbi:MAG: hypothetical protein NZM44_00225 [Candidatus Calescibacterium sp.]|nr:hypothetical protein [Candidatus Calescibacterium sp.]
MKKKKGQEGPMGMSFGVIFSIILIISFIFAAFFGIKQFLQLSECTQIGNFYESLQRKIDKIFYETAAENVIFEIKLPKKIKKICFANLSATITNNEDYEELKEFDFEDANLFLLPKEATCSMPYKKIEKIKMEEIVNKRNPYCIENSENIKLSKKIYDKYVILE